MNDKQTIKILLKLLEVQLEYFVKSSSDMEKNELPISGTNDEYIFLNCID